jgi:uncharacterized protein (TIGR02594 family)
MTALPPKYAWLLLETGPKTLVEALKYYGIIEQPGFASTPDIMHWAKVVGAAGYYHGDDIPWCGLFHAYVTKMAGYKPVADPLAAKNWAKYGTAVPKGEEMLGDTLVFSRPGGNHVGRYIGENKTAFLVYGGNQSDKVGFAFIEKSRLTAARRDPYVHGQPANVRKIHLAYTGEMLKNAA